MERRFSDEEVFNNWVDISYRAFYEYRAFLKEKGILKTRERLNTDHIDALKEIIQLKEETNRTYKELFEEVISRRFNPNTEEENISEIQTLSNQLNEGTFYICKSGIYLYSRIIDTKVLDDEVIEVKLQNGSIQVFINCINKVRRPGSISKDFEWCYLIKNEDGESLGYIGLTIPSSKELYNPVFQAIGNKKGSIDLSEIYDIVAEKLSISNYIRNIESKANSSKFENNLRWAIKFLHDYDLIENTGKKAEYQLTTMGKQFYDGNIDVTNFQNILEANYINKLIKEKELS